jgi:hypothetical protein
MSNLSELLPAGAGAKSASFVASGTLGSGVTVALKSDGTISAIGSSGSNLTPSPIFTSVQTFNSGGTTTHIAVSFDPNTNGKFVIAYKDGANSNYGTAVVGTISGTSISFGSEFVFQSNDVEYIGVKYDPNTANRIVICYQNNTVPYSSAVKVGTVSGTSISFGSENVISGSGNHIPSISFDNGNANTFVAIFSDSATYYGKAVVSTISGTSVSFGTAATYVSTAIYQNTLTTDPNNSGKFIVAYQDGSNSNYGTGIVGTISGTSISFGTATVFNSGNSDNFSSDFDPNNSGKFAVVYRDNGNSNYGTAVIGIVSGTSVAFGSESVFNTGSTQILSVSFDANNNNVFAVGYEDVGDSYYGKVVFGSVSGTNATFSSEVIFNAARTDSVSVAFNPNETSSLLIAYRDNGDSSKGKALLSTATNSSNFIGITDQAIADTATGAVIVQGGVSEKLSGLTVGADYYVQADGSISSPTASYPYNLSGGVYDSVSLAVSDNLTSIFFKPDGTKMYAIGYTNDTVYEYSLSSAFDLSTATLNGNTKNISAQSGYTSSLVFKSDGTKMYALGGGSVFQYSLSIAWDVSTASYESKSLTVSSQDSNSSGIWFKSDGTEMYMCGFTNDSIFQYDLSTAWDVSTGSYASVSFNMSATSTQPRNMYFNSTGTILFLADTANPDKVFKFVLSTSWDITTISFSNSLDVSAQAAKAVDVVLNADGTKMYVADSENTNTIYQYSLNGSTSTVPAGRALSTTSILLEG